MNHSMTRPAHISTLSIWDTVGDALQAAGEHFGMEPVATFKINPLDIPRFAASDLPSQPGEEATCPS